MKPHKPDSPQIRHVWFADNWFKPRRWQAYVEKQAEDRKKAAALAAEAAALYSASRDGQIHKAQASMIASRPCLGHLFV
ncbi:hypothetical protein [Roseobacter fucihabitans]|uniref:hypothetical protein n=1 Tax=Roseobacter fucihabitans TaxID=1537242 RepID=UPI0016531EB1|nr:hypothetical protein [Roseobacter litoralis]